jgi:flagellar biosynthesis chaperone FliJ
MPQYRMQTLLEIRQRVKEAAEQAFSEAMRALQKEKDELKRLEQDLENRKAQRKQKVEEYLQKILSQGTGVNGMNGMYRFEERLKDEEAQVGLDIEKQKVAVKAAERFLEEKRLEMADAAKELKAIEKHKEKWQKEIKHQREMREDLVGEEIGNALFLARTRKASN